MSRDWKMELYWRLPVRLQEAALSLYARHLEKVYYNPHYERWKEWLEQGAMSVSLVEEWKRERLQHIVRLAAARVAYYREAFKGYDWKSVRTESDLPLLPLLDKQALRQNEEAFLVDGLDPGSLWVEKTSGTTGTSLKIYWPMEMLPRYWGIVEVMVRAVAGVAQEMPRAMMGGRPVVPGDTSLPPYWRLNRRWKQLYFSSYHVSRKTSPHYVDALRRYGSLWMTGYGSAIAALAESASTEGIAPCTLRAVIVSGDTLLSGMRRSIEDFFQCKCFDHYGQSEGTGMAMECPQGRMHVIPTLGIIEILRDDGSACAAGEVGEIVMTSLLNDAMPLIRYRIGDFAAWAKEKGCPCGNPNPIVTHLEGRVDDYLVTADGRKIGRLSTAMKRSPTIHSSQIVQERPGHAFLLVRPGGGYQSSHAAAVRQDILERIGKFDLEIREVGEIPKTPQGKTVLVVRLEDRPYMREICGELLGISPKYV